MATASENFITSASTSMNPNRPDDTMAEKTCHLLRLPAELRHYVWDLAMTPDSNPYGKSINLLGAHLPGRMLILTCHQIHDEAHELYSIARDNFWMTQSSYLDVWTNSLYLTRCVAKMNNSHDMAENRELKALSKADIARIKSPIILGFAEHEYVSDNRVWTCSPRHGPCDGIIRACGCPKRTIMSKKKSQSRSVLLETRSIYEEGPRDLPLDSPGRSFWISLSARANELVIENAKKAAGWEHLTKNEILAMGRWYQRVQWVEKDVMRWKKDANEST